MESNIEEKIRSIFSEVFRENVIGRDDPSLVSDTVLLDTGLDSLGFAILVARLEEELGFDPFVLSSEAFYPRTFGEFVQFYKENAPK